MNETICELERAAKNPFGVLEFLHWNESWNNFKYPSKKEIQKAADLMVEAGVAWVRLDFLWQDIEPRKGEFNFTKYDMAVEILSERGINILGILNYCVDWASACGQWNCRPRDFAQFAAYAAAVSGRYKDRVLYWEVWNEPDSPTYWLEQDGLKGYCSLLREAYPAVKKVSPGSKVLNGGLCQVPSSVNKLYENGAKEYFDIMNIHIFENPVNPGREKSLTGYTKVVYNIMKRNSDGDKLIWITEIGCPGVKKGIKAANWWLGNNPIEEQQADWVKSVYVELLKDRNVERVFWAFFRDCKEHWNNGTDYFGLIRWDYSKKPAFQAYRDCVQKWFNARGGAPKK